MQQYRWTPKDAAEYLAADGYTPDMIAEMTVDELAEEVGSNAGDEIARRDADGNEEFAIATSGAEWKQFVEAGRSEMLARRNIPQEQ